MIDPFHCRPEFEGMAHVGIYQLHMRMLVRGLPAWPASLLLSLCVLCVPGVRHDIPSAVQEQSKISENVGVLTQTAIERAQVLHSS